MFSELYTEPEHPERKSAYYNRIVIYISNRLSLLHSLSASTKHLISDLDACRNEETLSDLRGDLRRVQSMPPITFMSQKDFIHFLGMLQDTIHGHQSALGFYEEAARISKDMEDSKTNDNKENEGVH